MLFQLSPKPLHFMPVVGKAIPANLLTHTGVMDLDYNRQYGREQCKGPGQDLQALLYNLGNFI